MHLSSVWATLKGGTSSPPPHPDDSSHSPNDHYTRPRHSRRRTNGSSGVHRVRSQSRSNSSATLLCGVFKMPPLFNLIRIGVFSVSLSPTLSPSVRGLLTVVSRVVRIAAVLLWTIIVLAIAIHFHGILTTNDLSECLTLGSGVGSLWDVKLTPLLARFIPFAIFVSAATIVLLLALSVPFHLRFSLPQGFSTGFFQIAIWSKESQPHFDKDRTRVPWPRRYPLAG
jgi:hypothetical protein